jgi:hypothetical protein
MDQQDAQQLLALKYWNILSPGTTNTEMDLSKLLKDAVPPSDSWSQMNNLQRSHLLFKAPDADNSDKGRMGPITTQKRW